MKIIDCRGLNCPEPVLRAKAALEQGLTEFVVLVDNQASHDNVLRFARSRECEVTSVQQDTGFEIRLVASGSTVDSEAEFSAADFPCELPVDKKIVYVISADSMGRGSDELGWALLQTYVATIGQLSPLPWRILFYNGGVKLVSTPGKALEALQKLSDQGVEIWSCGTCLEFFHLEKDLQVGQITNMYDILETMATADKLVSPY
ncbi:MAG: sulfurtransferase-like selenium metabolism protein YedF [Desulfobulbaceae bacterium]|uniref:Sulfurtransferase-like selenium metabolism protein YedF n=1 Tax=Candidatus Desulfatifera sulfidica TaxID=2841691 RepID=A0A8J6TA01_9BACT|nr:sulfurtransferase-like selenium metabolism protein YedF [Candidatus Desulfatifera sulfidica]